MKVAVTGGAGFIGSHLVEAILEYYDVSVLDDLSSGSLKNLPAQNKRLEFRQVSCTNYDQMVKILDGTEIVFHFAANPEVRLPSDGKTDESFERNVVATRMVLEAARAAKTKKIIFASTSTVYGEPNVIPTPEDYGPLKPISIYGATKLAAEAMVAAYCSSFNMTGIILRFANIIGARSNHGIIFDFCSKLQKNSKVLNILGDGKQTKSYLHIDDCIRAILTASKIDRQVDIINIGSEDQISVTQIARIVSEKMNLSPAFSYSSSTRDGRGWIGDVKNMLLDTSKIKKLGFKQSYNSAEAIEQTISELSIGR